MVERKHTDNVIAWDIALKLASASSLNIQPHEITYQGVPDVIYFARGHSLAKSLVTAPEGVDFRVLCPDLLPRKPGRLVLLPGW